MTRRTAKVERGAAEVITLLSMCEPLPGASKEPDGRSIVSQYWHPITGLFRSYSITSRASSRIFACASAKAAFPASVAR